MIPRQTIKTKNNDKEQINSHWISSFSFFPLIFFETFLVQLSETIRWAQFSECMTEEKISSAGNWFHLWKRAYCHQLPIHHGESDAVQIIDTANEPASNQPVISLQNMQYSLRTSLQRKSIELYSLVRKCINLCEYELCLYAWSFYGSRITYPCSLRLDMLCQVVHAHSSRINKFL